MHDKQSNQGSSRRDFFRSLFSEARKSPALETDAQQAMKRRASILALQHARDKMNLTQIGVEEPSRIGEENHLYRVRINGYSPAEVSVGLELHVDIAQGTAQVPEPEIDD